MARPAPTQRYIEPDEIYPDMGRGRPQQIPAQFPFTWTPVNGLGAAAAPASFFDDVVKSITDVTRGVQEDVTKDVSERAKQGLEDFLEKDPAGRALLDKIKQKAAEGVTEVVKKQAPNLMMLAVAGGAIGGVLSEKLGKTGTVLALFVAGWAGYQLLNAKVE